MIHLQQKSGEQKCLTYCAAMLLDQEVSILEHLIKTDGMEIWWPDFAGNKQYRGIHIQEVQDIFYYFGKCIYPVEHHPLLSPSVDGRFTKSIYTNDWATTRFFTRLIGQDGILIYQSHAKALHGNYVYDPSRPEIYEITVGESSKVLEAWLVGKIKS